MVSFNVFIYALDKIITPTVIAVADAEMRTKAMEIVNKSILTEYSKSFKYDEIIHIEKDNNNNIVMVKADTLKMNMIACDVALQSQNQIEKLGNVGIKIPMGYIFRNNILAALGPSITIKMQPIGFVETKYISDFESAGINQTRNKIYIQLITNIRVIIPSRSNDIEVKNEVPIAETIIVGKTPESFINLDLQKAGFKLNSK